MKRKTICIAMILSIFAGRFALAGAADAPSKVNFAYGAINAYLTSTWIAKEQGFFSKYNFEVQPVFIIATQAAQAMLAGEVQFGLIGPTHVINAVAAGGDMVMIMGNQNRVRYQLIAHPSIKRPEDLKGKTFGIGASMAGLASLAAFVALDHLGLNPRRDNITLLPTGSEPSRLAALKGGTTQATVIAPEISKAAIAEGFPVLVDMAKLNIPFQATGLTVLRKTLRSEPAMVDRMGRALADSVRFVTTPANKNTVVASMMKNLRISDRQRAEEVYADLLEDLPRSICPTMPGVRSIAKLMAEMGINPKAAQINVDDVVDLTLCKKWGGQAS
jgi:ABC-type nitrate/sulfonate/bicarbonate transport system substrate-binding protein